MKTTTYPEINALNLEQCNAALTLAELNRENLTPEALPEFQKRVLAILDRRGRLVATEARRQNALPRRSVNCTVCRKTKRPTERYTTLLHSLDLPYICCQCHAQAPQAPAVEEAR